MSTITPPSAATAEVSAVPGATPSFVPESPLHHALDDLAELLGSAEVFGDGGTMLTCGEADALALVLHLSGHTDAGVYLLAGHAEGDDAGDSHAHLIGPNERSELVVDAAAGRDYLRVLAGGEDDPDLRRRCERCSEFHTATQSAVAEGPLLCGTCTADNEGRVTL